MICVCVWTLCFGMIQLYGLTRMDTKMMALQSVLLLADCSFPRSDEAEKRPPNRWPNFWLCYVIGTITNLTLFIMTKTHKQIILNETINMK